MIPIAAMLALAGAALLGIGLFGIAPLGIALAAPASLTSDRADAPDLRAVPRPPALDLDMKISQAANPPAPQPGNPLWAVPFSSLTVTRERPLFSASRRPPPPPV